MKCLTAEQF